MSRSALRLADVQAVLWEAWDPIGVNQSRAAHGEYDRYAPQILSLLQNGATLLELTQHLSQLATVNMGLPANRAHDEDAARLLLGLRTEIR